MIDEHQRFWEGVRDCDKEIFSVFADKDAINPIFDALQQKPSGLVVADLGCGSGNFLEFLSSHFSRVIAVDYSRHLLELARERHTKRSNIDYRKMDLRGLSSLHGSLDIAITVNSVLPGSIEEAGIIFREIYKSLKPNGEYIGILPSAEVVIHYALLEQNRLIGEGMPEEEASGLVEEKWVKDRGFSFLGFYSDDGKCPPQKYFFPFEIRWRLRDAGFKSVDLDKVYYSWAYCREKGYGYFPEMERIWDWFVIAKKT